MNIKNKIIVFLSIKMIIFIILIIFMSFYQITPTYLCTLIIEKININKDNNNFNCQFRLTWNSKELTTKKIVDEAQYFYFPNKNMYWNLNDQKLKISIDNKIIIANDDFECQFQNQVVHLKLKKTNFLKYFLTKIIV